jgi:hypothetical protein
MDRMCYFSIFSYFENRTVLDVPNSVIKTHLGMFLEVKLFYLSRISFTRIMELAQKTVDDQFSELNHIVLYKTRIDWEPEDIVVLKQIWRLFPLEIVSS